MLAPTMGDGGRLSRLVQWATNVKLSPGWYRLLFALAAAVFVGGTILSVRTVDVDWNRIRWVAFIGVVVLGIPLMAMANAFEYIVSARVLGKEVGIGAAIRTTILASAANLLPVPGGPLVRTKALMNTGARVRSAVLVTILMAAVWLGIALVVAALLGAPDPAAAFGFGATGLAALVAAVAGFHVLVPQSRAEAIGWVALVEFATTVVTGLRIWLVAQAIGIDIGLGAFVLGTAPVLAAMVVFVPAGLGVREMVASVAAPAIGLQPATGFLISALDRVAEFVVLGVVSAAIGLTYRHSRIPTEVEP
jgi:hypothetical protein